MTLPQKGPKMPTSAARLRTPLDDLTARLADDLEEVNAIILANMHSEIPLIPELAGHLIEAGGKRIRPLLTLAAARLFGHEEGRQYRLAACVEFIHTATLLHDDVVDASEQRRGKASANSLFGNEAAVLVGDYLFSKSFQLMVEDGSIDVLRILSDASAIIAEGEVLQLATANDIGTTEEQYFRVIRSKTAALFAAACEVGAVVAGCPEEDCRAMREYGMALGIGFQISDDVLDYTAKEKRLGKTLGDDFREGKMTLPVICAIAKATPAETEFWDRCITDRDQKDGDFEEALELLRKHGALDEAMAVARSQGAAGEMALRTLPDGPLRQEMSELIRFAVERDY